uniref:Trypsinogen RdoT1 n=1 Tax=Rhyzopertha dominica TaxID=92692 RepID=Q9XYX9_RHYDO|nr:trypsinogen RdoT1 precursor [Rhyzopertha dominica]
MAVLTGLVLSPVTYVCAAPHFVPHLPNGKIVGGHDVSIEDYPYQVALLNNGYFICGGSILNEYFVLTAEHCTGHGNLKVRVGSSFSERGGTILNVKEIYTISDNSYAYDVPVLKLSEKIEFGKGIGPVKLPSKGSIPPAGTKSVVSGWGVLHQGDGETADVLQAVEVPIVNLKDCQEAYGGDVDESMICAGEYLDGGKDSCQGDSGGPLVINGVQYGIVSWGYGCALPGYPGVYGSVLAAKDFIDQFV